MKVSKTAPVIWCGRCLQRGWNVSIKFHCSKYTSCLSATYSCFFRLKFNINKPWWHLSPKTANQNRVFSSIEFPRSSSSPPSDSESDLSNVLERVALSLETILGSIDRIRASDITPRDKAWNRSGSNWEVTSLSDHVAENENAETSTRSGLKPPPFHLIDE